MTSASCERRILFRFALSALSIPIFINLAKKTPVKQGFFRSILWDSIKKIKKYGTIS